MRVNVALFAAARQAIGRDSVAIELADGARVADLRRALAVDCPELASLLAYSRIASGSDYADDDAVIGPDSQLAIIPPVSGG